MTTFIHLRYRQPVETLMGTWYEVLARGGLTIAYALDEDRPEIHMAFAKCCKKDLFNKKRGRVIAEGRLKSPSYRHTIAFTDAEFNSILEDRRNIHDYVVGSLPSVIPEGAVDDLHELLSAHQTT